MKFLSFMVDGVSLGSVYAIIAVGYTMVYGIAKMLNFAHGDVIMIGSYLIYIFMNSVGMNPLLSLVVAMGLCTILGMVIERVAYRPLRQASKLAVLITAIGVSYFLQNIALIIFGADAKSFPSFAGSDSTIQLAGGQFVLTVEAIVTILTCIVVVIFLVLFVKKTKPGHAMQAVSEDMGAARLMGVNVNGTIALTFAIGSALAAVAGLLMCSAYPTLNPYTGSMPGIKAFTAAVFGGVGSIPGAMLGGILLGIIEILSKAYISSQLSDAIVFAVLIIILIFKPEGIFGKKVREKI